MLRSGTLLDNQAIFSLDICWMSMITDIIARLNINNTVSGLVLLFVP